MSKPFSPSVGCVQRSAAAPECVFPDDVPSAWNAYSGAAALRWTHPTKRHWTHLSSFILRSACGAMFALGIAALLGCGPSYPPRAPVSGVVTFRGEPVREGTITFFPTEGRSALGKIQPDGTYSLTTFETGDGAILGEHQVTIKATKIHGEAAPKSFEEELARGTSGSGSLVPGEVQWIVPEEYSNRSTSKLKATVKSGENQINFELPMN